MQVSPSISNGPTFSHSGSLISGAQGRESTDIDEDTIQLSSEGPTVADKLANSMAASSPKEPLKTNSELAATAQAALAVQKPRELSGPRLGLVRSSFSVYSRASELPADYVPTPDKSPPVLEGCNSPFNTWPLYNEFLSNIDRKDPSTWPPKNVLLQDWHIWKLLLAEVSFDSMKKNWPADFSRNGMPFANRKPRGCPAKIKRDGIWYYIVTQNGYQLFGDEGATQRWIVAKERRPDEKFAPGPRSLIQERYLPLPEELTGGIYKMRYPPESVLNMDGLQKAHKKRKRSAQPAAGGGDETKANKIRDSVGDEQSQADDRCGYGMALATR